MATKTVKEITTDVGGNVSIEYSDDSTSSFNIANTVTASTNLTGGIELIGPGGEVIEVGGGGVLSAYTGPVASRCHTATSLGAMKYAMAKSRHVAVDSISAIQIVQGAWYATSAGELLPSADLTYKVSIEYAGVITPLTWTGATEILCTNGGTVVSDMVVLPSKIPAGAAFFVRTYVVSSATAFVYSKIGGLNPQNGVNTDTGEFITFGASPNDLTAGGVSTNGGANMMIYPIAILGKTAKPTFFLAGDSRLQNGPTAYDSIMDGKGLLGVYEKNIGQAHGTINTGVAAASMTTANGAAYAKRSALAQYCSHVVSNYGVNDVLSGRTLAQLKTDLALYVAQFAAKPIYWSTAEPVATSTDGWATTANQTTSGTNAVRTSWNDYLRAGAVGITGILEIADIFESSRNSGIWKAPSTPNAVVTASISGTTMTLTGVTSGSMQPGMGISGAGVTAGSFVKHVIAGSGASATFEVSVSQTVASTSITGTASYTSDGTHANKLGQDIGCGASVFDQLYL